MFLALVLHLLGASVWVGGHIILFFSILPGALKARDTERILSFEKRFEVIGIPALLLQVITGLWMADRYVPGVFAAFEFGDRIQSIVAFKLILLLVTITAGLHARFGIIPKLTPKRLPFLAWHIGLVTMVAIAMLVLGAAVRI